MEERKILETLGYKVNNRKFSDIKKLFSEDYLRVMPNYKSNHILYSGAEHRGNPKLPNITILPNISIEGEIVLGSTMGHQHTQSNKFDLRMFQEIYEFLGYGGMLLRNNRYTNFHILKPGEKIIVGTDDNMTIFNLEDKPLITLDYSNPHKNSANKDLESKVGPSMLIKENGQNIFIKTNPEYYKRRLMQGESKLIVIENTKLGKDLHWKINNYKNQFENGGINLVLGGNIPYYLKKDFSPPLLELALRQDKRLIEELGIYDNKD